VRNYGILMGNPFAARRIHQNQQNTDGVTAIAVDFLHAYRYPHYEQPAARWLIATHLTRCTLGLGRRAITTTRRHDVY
jgi:N-methylhydantoinase A/oxoprolinase/acetone carboxylase beta subunit